MKAIIWTKYGPPELLQLKEVEKPVPRDSDVLIKIHATSVTSGDCEIRRMDFPLWIKIPLRIYMGVINPKSRILGAEFSGVVEQVGKDVTNFSPGDQVFGTTGMHLGTYAEYIVLPSDAVMTSKPTNMTHEKAAPVCVGGLNALHYVRMAQVQAGQHVLVNGAGGSFGTYIVQLLKHQGAHVTAVDSGPKLDMLRSLGADEVVDYTKEDFTKRDETYDIIIDVPGKAPMGRSISLLPTTGRMVVTNPRFKHLIRGFWTQMTSKKKVILKFAKDSLEDLNHLRELIEAGKIVTPIDRTYPLEEMAAAHAYVESGAKKGHVVITVVAPGSASEATSETA